MAKDKKKKEKYIYYDDGSTLADMSAFTKDKANDSADTPKYGFKAKMQTFFGAMRLMLIPLVAVVCALGLIYGVIYLLFTLASRGM